MKKQFKLGVIGCNPLAFSLVKGAVLSDFLREKKVIVCDKSENVLDDASELGVFTTDDELFVAKNSEYLVFGGSLRDFPAVCKSLNGFIPEKVLTLIDGLTKSNLKNSLGIGAIRVARCVVNYAGKVGSGAIGLDMTDFNNSTDDSDFISNLLSNLGECVSISENKLDAVAGVISGGTSLVFMLIDALTDAGVKCGLSKDEANAFAVQTVFGSAEMAKCEDLFASELLIASCKESVGLEAVKQFESANFSKVIESAVKECANKEKELSKK